MNAQVMVHTDDKEAIDRFNIYLAHHVNDAPVGQWIIYAHTKNDFPHIAHNHIHAYIIAYRHTSETLRENIKKIFGVKRGQFTVSETYEKDGERHPVNDDAITYMSKGRLEPLHNHIEDKQLVEDKKRAWIEPEVVTKVVLQGGKLLRAVDESKKKTKRQLVEEMIAEIGDKKGHSVETTIGCIRKVLVRNNEVIGMYKVIEYYDSVLMYSQIERWCESIAAKINSRIRV